MVAFINEFIISTVSFLNEFMTKCETKFVEFEQKMQRIEASLLIVEAKVLRVNRFGHVVVFVAKIELHVCVTTHFRWLLYQTLT